MCLLHLRRRQRLNRREREFWEHPIVAARTPEGAYYTLYGRLREDERKFCNYFRMSTSTFDYIVDRLDPHLERQNTMMRESSPLIQSESLCRTCYTFYPITINSDYQDEQNSKHLSSPETQKNNHMKDECAPALRTVPAYLSRGSPTSRRHVGGRRGNFVVSAPCTAWP